MKSFIIKSSLFFIIVIFVVSLLLITIGKFVDPFYEKFTTPKQFSIILGDSRSLQGIQPKVLDSCLIGSKFKLPMYNFSFTIAQIAYGPSYLQSLKRKLDSSESNQLFILTVDPLMLNGAKNITNDSDLKNSPPHNMVNMTMNPNFEYFIKNYRYFNFQSIFGNYTFLHKDGWSEPLLIPYDYKTFLERKQENIDHYNKYAKNSNISNYRLKWLNKTTEYLQQFGKVVYVRMPIDKDLLDVENNSWKSFDFKIDSIAKVKNTKYFNFSANRWKTYDGQHLDKNASKIFTEKLSKLIKEI